MKERIGQDRRQGRKRMGRGLKLNKMRQEKAKKMILKNEEAKKRK